MRNALEEGAAHPQDAAHWAHSDCVNLLYHGTKSQRGMLGLHTAHRADNEKFYRCSTKFQITQLFPLHVDEKLINGSLVTSKMTKTRDVVRFSNSCLCCRGGNLVMKTY